MCLLKAAIQLALTSVFIFLGLPIQNYCQNDLTQLKFILTFQKARSLKPRCQQIMLVPSFFHAPSSLRSPAIPGAPWILVVHLWSLLLSSHGLLPCVCLITTRVIGLRAHPDQSCLQKTLFPNDITFWDSGTDMNFRQHCSTPYNISVECSLKDEVLLNSQTFKFYFKKTTKESFKFSRSKML